MRRCGRERLKNPLLHQTNEPAGRARSDHQDTAYVIGDTACVGGRSIPVIGAPGSQIAVSQPWTSPAMSAMFKVGILRIPRLGYCVRGRARRRCRRERDGAGSLVVRVGIVRMGDLLRARGGCARACRGAHGSRALARTGRAWICQCMLSHVLPMHPLACTASACSRMYWPCVRACACVY